MNWAALSRHIARWSILLAAAAIANALLRQSSAFSTLAHDSEGLGILITLIGAIYAVVFAFVIFVIWGQFTEVETLALRECSALSDLLRFNQHLNPDTSRAIRRAVTEYAQRVANGEWHSLGELRRDQPAEKAFASLISAVLRTVPATPTEPPILERMIDIARKAGEQRDERIAKSLTRIPPMLLVLVRFMAAALVALIFVFPFHSWMIGTCGFIGLGAILFLSNLVMTDTDNPFDGIFNVSAQPFLDLAR